MLEELARDSTRGLSAQEAALRLTRDGPNELPRTRRRSVLRITAEVVREPMFGLLLLAGVLYVYYNRFINPVAASFQISVEVSLMAIVGGSGTIVGPFIGAGIFLGLRNWVSSFFELHTAVMGAVFIATVLWAPSGIVGLVERWRARLGKPGGES